MDAAVCNIFKNVWDTKCSHEYHVINILSAIRNGKWKDKIEAYRAETDGENRRKIKNALPCVTFCGTFKTRKASEMKDYSGVMVIDIDNIKESSLDRFKRAICNDVHTAACFVSPGKGLKVLFVTDQPQKYHKTVFNEVKDYFHNNYRIEIDKSGKDVSRLCFISYDPELYFNNDYELFTCDAEAIEERFNSRDNYVSDNMTVSNDANKVMEVCVKFTNNSSIGRYAKGNRNNYVHALSCNLNRAGMDVNTAISMISARYASLSLEEVNTTVKSAYNNKSEFGTKPILERKTNQNQLF